MISYLKYSKNCVKTNSCPSNITFPFSGIPQGSILSPFLFSLLVNGALSVLCLRYDKILIFTNDMKCLVTQENLLLQEELKRMIDWGEALRLVLKLYTYINAKVLLDFSIDVLSIYCSIALSICNQWSSSIGSLLLRNH